MTVTDSMKSVKKVLLLPHVLPNWNRLYHGRDIASTNKHSWKGSIEVVTATVLEPVLNLGAVFLHISCFHC